MANLGITLRAISFLLVLCASTLVHAVDIGRPAPAFQLPVFGAKDRHLALNDVRGKVVLLDFWASWCGPCRQSFPLYEKLRAEMPAADFTLLAINLDEMTDAPQTFLSEHPVQYTSLADPAGEVAKAYGLLGMPSSYVIDRDGIVRARHIGFKPDDIEPLRKEILGLIGNANAK
jgi:peroxiredoxin